MATEFSGKAQYNVGIEAELNARLLAAINDLGVKKRATQIISEIVEEYFDLWYVTETVKRQKIDQVKALVREKRRAEIEVDPSVRDKIIADDYDGISPDEAKTYRTIAEKYGTENAQNYENQMNATDKPQKRKRA